MQLPSLATLFAATAAAVSLTLAAPTTFDMSTASTSRLREACRDSAYHCVYPGNTGIRCTNSLRDVSDSSGRFLIYDPDVDAECHGRRGGVITINFRTETTYIEVAEEGIRAALSNRRFDVISVQGQWSNSGEGGSDVYLYN